MSDELAVRLAQKLNDLYGAEGSYDVMAYAESDVLPLIRAFAGLGLRAVPGGRHLLLTILPAEQREANVA